jgi:carbamoyltransferase
MVLDHPFWQPAPQPGADPLRPPWLLPDSGFSVKSSPDPHALAAHIAGRLAAGRIVAVWQERGEIGQRALGARSLLCDPRDRHALVRLNDLKGREMWRPVTPSVQLEYWDDLFAMPAQPPANFMLAAYPVRADTQRLIPACVHVDGSARPQAVSRSGNPLYWQIIDQFRQLTGVPAVLNTSFNLAGEPIVYTLDDAISTFVNSPIDTLVAGPMVLEK